MKQEQTMGVLGNRYQLLYALGAGGMGVVYRAQDRLTGEPVALKRVLLAPQNLAFNSRSIVDDTDSLLLALAQEFRLLAALRHPNIISVLDYGFDAGRQPYFTMELLSLPQTLLQAGQGRSLAAQTDLLVQTLQALAYLHRRGILHRDLKPGNVLVSGGRVRVLDFGLAVGRDQAQNSDVSGTLLYLAPEVLEGAAPSEAADLYAVGVMAYELFTGRPPFQSVDPGQLLLEILEEDPDLTPLDGLTPAGARRTLPAILLRLLSKQPALRYPSAEAVIVDLCAVLNQPPPESVAIRESFLQAATFVGREQELAQLTAALAQALQGQGSAWLIGGESGVGKSRLLDELRIQALVAGALVLRGQAVEGGGLSYQLWREPLRRLVLTAELSTLAAGVLKEIVPDIADLIGRDVPEAPALPGEAGRQRLLFTVVELFKQQSAPLVVLLEDLHWSSESLTILQQLNPLATTLPLLIVANYRDDERPQLATELPAMQVIKLARLTTAQIRDLSSAMLGAAGQQPELITLLQHETEGNTFFMVEAIRALAESAGGLLGIGRMTLPHSILAGGVQQTLQRRLAQIPTRMQPLLQLAAVAGRQLDLKVLDRLAKDNLEAWLTACADVAVLEIDDGIWRFVHDKLRTAVLTQLGASTMAALHRQVAETIEQVYTSDHARETQAEILLEHWQQAGEPHKEIAYGLLAGRNLVKNGEYRRAEAILKQSLAVVAYVANVAPSIHQQDTDHQDVTQSELAQPELGQAVAQTVQHQAMQLWCWLGEALEEQAIYAQAGECYQQSLDYAQRLGDQAGQVDALWGYGSVCWRQEKFAMAADLLRQSVVLAQQLQDPEQIANCLACLANIICEQGDPVTGNRYAEEALALQRACNNQASIATSLNNIGVNLGMMGDYTLATQYLVESLTLARLINDRRIMAVSLVSLASVSVDQGDYPAADRYASESLSLANELNLRQPIPWCLFYKASSALAWGDFATARSYFLQALDIWQGLQIIGAAVDALNYLSWMEEQEGDYPKALAYGEQSLQLTKAADNQVFLALALLTCSRVYFQLHNLPQAQSDLDAALALACRKDDPYLRINALLGVLLAQVRAGQFTQAAILAGLLDKQPSLVPLLRLLYFNPLLDELQSNLAPEALSAACEEGKSLELQTYANTIFQEQQKRL